VKLPKAAIKSVPQSHVSRRTNANPSRMSRSAERACSDFDMGRALTARRAANETRNEPASARNAVPGPTVATTRPPSAGPTSLVAGRMK
jgi:hypothetical protein